MDEAAADGGKVMLGGSAPDRRGTTTCPRCSATSRRPWESLERKIFGPVGTWCRISSDDEVIGLANNTEFGLVSYLYSGDLRRGCGRRRRSRSAWSDNRGIVSDPAAPFGGSKQSGIGREGVTTACSSSAREVHRGGMVVSRRPYLDGVDRRIFGLENEYGVTCTFHGRAPVVAGRGSQVPVPPGGVLGAAAATYSCATARAALPGRGQPPRVRDARMRQRAGFGRARQGGERILEGLLSTPTGGCARKASPGHLPVQEQHRLGRQLPARVPPNYLVGRAVEFGPLATS